MIRFISILVFSVALLFSCSTKLYVSKEARNWKNDTPPDSSLIRHTVYLLGDAGEPSVGKPEPTFLVLKKMVEKDSNSSLVFLGDNIYHDGLPPESAPNREKSEQKLIEQMKILENYKGHAFFIPGNHDWDYMKEGGYQAIRRQEQFLEDYLKRGNVFQPDNGCPGPVLIRVNKEVVLITIDSQWWLHKHHKPYGRSGDCPAEDEADFLVQLEDFIEANKNKHIVITAHHPMISNGNHGGFYPLLDHLFPLRLIRDKWYLPLPILGSLYPLHRKFGGTDQDLAHYRYNRFKQDVMQILNNYKNIVYAAGHEHNLQYHKLDSIYHLISGSGSKLTPVRGGNGATFAQHSKGFALIKYYANSEAWVEFWTPTGDSTGEMSFRSKLYSRWETGPALTCGLTEFDYSDSSVVVAPGMGYDLSILKEETSDKNYKQEWAQPINIELLDLISEEEGVLPYGKTGGENKKVLKFKDYDNHEFRMTLLKEDAFQVFPEELSNNFLNQNLPLKFSGQHPYGAFAIPALSKAIGIFYLTPKLMYIPNDSCLGPYRAEFHDQVGIFEENPLGNHEQAANLGRSREIVGTDRMISKLEESMDNKVDEREFAASRLLDMLVNDWDKREKEYRWASFESGKFVYYRPVAEDRDKVFFRFEGFLPALIHRSWAIPNIQDFDARINNVKGLTLSAKNMDRRLLTGVTREEWKLIADSIRIKLNDEVLKRAVQAMPKEAAVFHGEEILEKLRSRRDQLPEVAEEYYEVLAKYVDLFGSGENDKFIVTRMNDMTTRVRQYQVVNGKRDVEVYDRIFNSNETKEIRLYGLEGGDVFQVSGEVRKGIKVRIIGGKGSDTITDNSKVSRSAFMTIIYDTKEGNVIKEEGEANRELSVSDAVHVVEQDQFFYTHLGPLLSFQYNQDDRMFLHAGVMRKAYRFRRDPFYSRHKLMAGYASSTGSFQFLYKAELKKFLSALDLDITADLINPYVMNFSGYGNESKPLTGSIDFYRERLKHEYINITLNRTITHFFVLGAGPKWESFRLDENNTLAKEAIAPVNADLYSRKNYLGLRGFFRLGTADNLHNPSRGIFLTGEANYNFKLGGGKGYSQYTTEFRFYISPNASRQLTLATRIGFASNSGEYEFYQANILGGADMLRSSHNLRGFRKTRFIGDQIFYQNLELRKELFKLNVYLFPSRFGVLALLDNGKVWARGESSKKWHTGYGGGVWLNVFNRMVLSATYTFSAEDHFLNVKTGFSF